MIIPNDRNNSNIKLLKEEGKVLSNDDTPTYINNYFSTVGEDLARHICDPAKLTVKTINQTCQDNFMDLEQLELNDVTMDQLMTEIVKIDIYKSSGLDNLSSRFIKDAFLSIPDVVLHLINLILCTSIYCDQSLTYFTKLTLQFH